MAQGRACPGRGVPQGVCPGEHRRPTAARQPQHPTDRRRVHGGREAVQVSLTLTLALGIERIAGVILSYIDPCPVNLSYLVRYT